MDGSPLTWTPEDEKNSKQLANLQQEVVELRVDKTELAKQIRQLQLDLDARTGQIHLVNENLASVRAVRDKLEAELNVYKQILDDLHSKILDKTHHY